MTEPALVSAQPWSHLEARAGLLDRATVATGSIGGVRVRVLPEPLLAEREGTTVQAVRLLIDGRLPDPATATLTGPAGDLVVGSAPAPDDTSVRLLVRAVAEPTEVSLTLSDLGDETISFVLLPQRAWSVHVVHHSHFDFGYTDPQTAVISSQRSYLDSAVELAGATSEWPDAARFRWNVEALWAFADW